MKTYATIREAAIAGLAAAMPLAQKNGWEYGGYIRGTQASGFYPVLPAVTGESPVGVNLGKQLESIMGGQGGQRDKNKKTSAMRREFNIVSVYHVHGCDWDIPGSDPEHPGDKLQGEPAAKVFSGQDLIATVKWGFEHSYIAVACTGDVYESPDTQDLDMGYLMVIDAFDLGGETGEGGMLIGNIRDAT